MIITILTRGADPRVLYTGDHVDLRAAVVHCAANGISLAWADLRAADLSGANLSGLHAPNADLTGANMTNVVANRTVAASPSDGRILDLCAASLQQAVITGTLTHANLACTHPTAFRATLGPNTRIKGANFSECPDVLELTKTARGTRMISVRNGTGWLVHTGDDRDGANACLPEAQAHVTHGARSEYQAPLQWLASPDGKQQQATIDARPVGSGEPVKPPREPAGSDGAKLGGGAR